MDLSVTGFLLFRMVIKFFYVQNSIFEHKKTNL
ncbi:hypothetical protein J2Y38_003324 [Flavobacterium sp. 2755]|nr:hypothetical protein [Flavobacterium sp. 2755]